MKTYATYGFLWALAGAIVTLALFFFGFHSDPAKLKAAQLIGTIVGLAISIAFIVLGTKARRAEIPPAEPFGYGRALGTGVMIALFATVFGTVFNFIYMHYINAGMQELIVQAQIDQLQASGKSADQIEMAEKIIRKMMNPAVQAGMYLLGGVFFGLLISLVTSAFLKRDAVEQLPPVVA